MKRDHINMEFTLLSTTNRKQEAEMTLLSDLVHLEEIMSSLNSQSQNAHTLPGNSEQAIHDLTNENLPEGWSCQVIGREGGRRGEAEWRGGKKEGEDE